MLQEGESRNSDPPIDSQEIERIVKIKRSPGRDEIHWEEGKLRAVLQRASRLSLDELKELLLFVGIVFSEPEVLSVVDCLEVLDEAKSVEKIEEFLDAHGV